LESGDMEFMVLSLSWHAHGFSERIRILLARELYRRLL